MQFKSKKFTCRKTDYSFRLCCHDTEYDDVAVWTNLLKISLRSSAPLVQQTNHNGNPSPNFHSHPCPNNSFLERSHTRQVGMGRDAQVGGGGQPVE